MGEIYVVILSVITTGIINALLYYLKFRKELPLQAASVENTKATTIESLQRSLDNLTEQYLELQQENLQRGLEIKELRISLDSEIEKRRALEVINQEYNKGVLILIAQLERLQVIPEWKPNY